MTMMILTGGYDQNRRRRRLLLGHDTFGRVCDNRSHEINVMIVDWQSIPMVLFVSNPLIIIIQPWWLRRTLIKHVCPFMDNGRYGPIRIVWRIDFTMSSNWPRIHVSNVMYPNTYSNDDGDNHNHENSNLTTRNHQRILLTWHGNFNWLQRVD